MLSTLTLPGSQRIGQLPQAHAVCLHRLPLCGESSFACAKGSIEEAASIECHLNDTDMVLSRMEVICQGQF